VDVEYRIARPDGTIRWIHDRGFQIRDAAGHLIRLAGIASDITERKLTVQQLAESEEREAHSRRALAHEHELNQIKSRFVSMVSHEFRTPLSVISMAGSLLGRYFDRMSQPERDTEIAEIQTAVKRMTQMMEDLLVHENILAGKMVCRPAWINLVAFCWELIAETTKHLYPPRAITCHIDPAAREAFLDEKFLRHVLGNLLSNALKYSADGQPVALEVKRVAGNPPTGGATTGMAEHLQLTVRDSGIGIPAADLARLFGTFHRASNVGNRPGTGMGLAIVKQFLDLHQGTIQIQSEEGKGTTVVVCLPIISAAGPAAATPPPPAEIQLVNL
jgi:signal transduction histidine kinase